MGEHSIDMQRFLPYKMMLGRLSFWEEAKVNGLDISNCSIGKSIQEHV